MVTAAIRAVALGLLAPLALLADEPDSELELRNAARDEGLVGVPAAWAEETPLPGEPVKFRLRGAALSHILSFPGQFELTADGEPIAAQVVLPEPRQEPERVRLELKSESGPEAPDLVLDLDRGEQPEPINRLELELASRKLLAKGYVAAGDSFDNLSPASQAQLAYQELKNGRLLQLTTLTCDPGDSRYLRVRLVGAGGTKVQQVAGWLEAQDDQAAYGVAAALGSMYDGLLEGEHKWPVILADTRLPLAKLKVLADAPGETRLMSAVREDQSAGTSEIVQFTWADGLQLAGLELSNKWVELSGISTDGGLTISVEDGAEQPLQLKGIQAYAYEVWLVFERPESDDVVLWLDQERSTEQQPGFPARLELARAFPGGELSEPKLERPDAQPGIGHEAATADLLFGSTWFKVLAYCTAALVLLIIGLVLLGRPRQTA